MSALWNRMFDVGSGYRVIFSSSWRIPFGRVHIGDWLMFLKRALDTLGLLNSLLYSFRPGDKIGDLIGVLYPLVYDCLYEKSWTIGSGDSAASLNKGVMLISGNCVIATLSGASLRPGLYALNFINCWKSESIARGEIRTIGDSSSCISASGTMTDSLESGVSKWLSYLGEMSGRINTLETSIAFVDHFSGVRLFVTTFTPPSMLKCLDLSSRRPRLLRLLKLLSFSGVSGLGLFC